MPRSVDDQQTRNLEIKGSIFVHYCGLRLDCFHGEVCGTNLLGDTACFTFLDVGLTNLQPFPLAYFFCLYANLTLSRSLVFPVSTCPRIQQIGLLKLSLLAAAFDSSSRCLRRAAAAAFRSTSIRFVVVKPSSEEESSTDSSLSSSESESESESDDSSSLLDSGGGAAFEPGLAEVLDGPGLGAAASFAATGVGLPLAKIS